METKLILSLEKEDIEKAEVFAKQNGESLSKMVENYLKNLNPKSSKTQSTPDTGATSFPVIEKNNKGFDKIEIKTESKFSELAGVLKVGDDFDYKKIYEEELLKKYDI
ncbi:MAG TPA: hypothetical protein ENH91_04795 [Leeuwenhoekiella sp.]|nr:hypothetical protein [Leeuwenhoekiella sp.]